MRILVLGGSGYIGKRLVETLHASPWATAVSASRASQRKETSREFLQIDTCNEIALRTVLKDFDAVVNCVAGDERSIAVGARALTQAALTAQCPRIVHLSTMSVYGPAEGDLREDAPMDSRLGWYGRAKCEAETQMADFVQEGCQAVVLRPGCVFGPGNELWVGRVGRWLQAGRLGDLGAAGDGWSNLVHVDDVCQAIVAALQLPALPGKLPSFNLAAPDSPRWNEYFVDLSFAIKATPVRRLSPRRLRLDALLAGPALKVAQMAQKRLGWRRPRLPDPMPPALVRFWQQQLHMDSTAATRCLGLSWTPYAMGLQSSVNWFVDSSAKRGAMVCKAA